MAEEREKHTIRLLQDLRNDMHERFDKIEAEQTSFRNEVNTLR